MSLLTYINSFNMMGFVQDFEQEEERDGAGGSDSDMDDKVGWSTVNLDEEQKHTDVSQNIPKLTSVCSVVFVLNNRDI